MPSARFTRLPLERQQEILRVARAHFGRDGRDGASFNQMLAEANLPKASAYLYFDGKDDLAAAVLADLHQRLLGVLGPWQPAPTARVFWKQLTDSSDRLRHHLLSRPDDLACLGALGTDGTVDATGPWFEAMIDDGLALSVIRRGTDRGLLIAATMGVFAAVDRWAITQLAKGAAPPMKQAWRLLERLWGGPA